MGEESEIIINDEQIQKILKFCELSGRDTPDLNDKRDLWVLSRYVYAFDNDPVKAANKWNEICEEADTELNRVYEEMHAHIPKPTEKRYEEFFESKEAAEAYKKKVNEKAIEASTKVLESFYDEMERRLKQIEVESYNEDIIQ